VTIIICDGILIFPLLWLLFLWCKCVYYWYIRVSQAMALVKDLHIWLSVYVSEIAFFLFLLFLSHLRFYDHIIGFKHIWSSHNTHHGKCTQECMHTMYNTICIIKKFVSCEIWGIEIFVLYWVETWDVTRWWMTGSI
jgi:hypothetical protein